MLDRRSIPIKLALAVGIPVVASLLFAVLALRTVEQVRIGSPTYKRVALANDLTADLLPPPLFIVESFSVAQEMTDAPDEASLGELKGEMETLRARFEAAHLKWAALLDPASPDDAPLRKLLVDDAYQLGAQFYATVVSDLYPAVESGIRTRSHDQADDVVTNKLDPLFEQHKAAVVAAIPLLDSRVTSLEGNATSSARRGFLVLIVALVALTVAALALAALVGRAIVRPIRRLTRAADEVATTLRDANLDQEAPELEPIELDSSQELNQAAGSFNTLVGTTTDLLDRHARVRRNLGDIFQNLGRRNHGLLTRSLQVITELEQTETDSATLERLFRLDHLATRMRRNAENLLVLAGSQSARPAERQAGISEIIRSALSEIEAYTKVDRPELEPVEVKAGAVADVTHLLAELIENATNFSPPECKVRVIGAFVEDGYAVTVVDEGLGMRDDAIEEANQRITRVTGLDLTPTRTLGLYVVGRLAQRQGIRVRLLEGSLRGMVAKVVLPMHLLAEARSLDDDLDYERYRYERALEGVAPMGGRGRSPLVTSRGPQVYEAPRPMAAPAPYSDLDLELRAAALAARPRDPHLPHTPVQPPSLQPPSVQPPSVVSGYRAPSLQPPSVQPPSVVSGYRAPTGAGAIAPPERPLPPMPGPEPARVIPPEAPTAAPMGEGRPGPDGAQGQVEERNGMRRRVRGAQLPQTQLTGLGPSVAQPPEAEQERSEVLRHQRDSLRSFQHAVEQGTLDGRSAEGDDA